MRIKYNLRAFEEIRRLPKVEAMLGDAARRVAAGCGPGYDVHVEQGRTRARAAVVTATVPAMIDNSRNQTLLKNLGNARV